MTQKNTTPPIHLPLWTGPVPGQLDASAETPYLEFYRANRAAAPCILICPGGGYAMRAAHEGEPVARWLNTLGVHAVVVHYRVFPNRHPSPLNDLSQAVRLNRQHAAAWGVDAARLGVLGFSAGGHLASTLCTIADAEVRPALAILLYPVITLGEPSAHTGSRKNLVPDADPAWIDGLSSERHVTAATPPTFLFHTVDDAAVPVENALLYAAALRRHGVPFEMHLFETGHHGVGLATDHPALSTWPTLCRNWLAARGWVGE